jgi:hypothetical protein
MTDHMPAAKPALAKTVKPRRIAPKAVVADAPAVPAVRKSAARRKAATTSPDAAPMLAVVEVEPVPSGGLSDPLTEAPHQVPVFQIFFEAAQRSNLDPGFLPCDNAGQNGPLREFNVFERLAAEEAMRIAPLWGAVSWKFSAKTGLDGEGLAQALRQHPGCDLYYCNPSPETEALYANLWQQGVTAHPGFREICESVFEAAGLDPRQLDAITPSQGFSSCNYFIGSQAFWRSYLPFVRGIVDQARASLPKSMARMLDSSLGDPRNLHAGASYWPFIVERLLPLYLRGPGAALKIHKITLPGTESRLNTHLKRLREMKDVAHRTRSQWLYSCWLNYRNLYLLQTAGRDWCTRYLPQLSPAEISFW